MEHETRSSCAPHNEAVMLNRTFPALRASNFGQLSPIFVTSAIFLAAGCTIDNGIKGRADEPPAFDSGDTYVAPVETGDTSSTDSQDSETDLPS